MGNTSLVSSLHGGPESRHSSAGQSHPKGKKVISAKLASAEKTGVLNLVDQDLKPTSSVWPRLAEPTYVYKLKSLDISTNQLKTLPLEVHGLTNLKILQANNCNLQALHNMSAFIKMTNLRLNINDLEEHKIHTFPANVTHLYLAMNHFKTVPPSVCALRMLVILDLSGNRIQNLDGLEVLTLLCELHLNDNMLAAIPSSLGALKKLRFLNLENNKLHRTADASALDQETKDDHGDENKVERQVQSIAKEVFMDTALITLQLAGNPITSRELMTFEGIDDFLDRWKATRDKSIQGGGMLEQSLFGLH